MTEYLIEKYLGEGSGTVPTITKFEKDKYVVDDYPFGGKRTKATFEVVKKGSKQSVTRVTVNPKTGREAKPKRLTYGMYAIIGIASDGKVYPMIFSGTHIKLYSGNMKHSLATVFPDDPDYDRLFKEFK